jgi:probable phosphoglycerate mutase
VGLGGAACIEPDLAEWDYGDYEGKRSADISKERPGWNLFRDGVPNGESLIQISTRVDRLLSHLRPLNGDVALFSHGHISRVLAARWIGLPVSEGQHLSLDTGSLSILGSDAHHPELPIIELWNARPETLATTTELPPLLLGGQRPNPQKPG